MYCYTTVRLFLKNDLLQVTARNLCYQRLHTADSSSLNCHIIPRLSLSSHSVIGPIIWFWPNTKCLIPRAHPVDFYYLRIKTLCWTLTNKKDLYLYTGRFYRRWPPVHLVLSIHCFLVYWLQVWLEKMTVFFLHCKSYCNTPQKLITLIHHSFTTSICSYVTSTMSVLPWRTGFMLPPKPEEDMLSALSSSWKTINVWAWIIPRCILW